MTISKDFSTRQNIVERAFADLAEPAVMRQLRDRVLWSRTTDAAIAEFALNPRKLSFEQLGVR